MNTIIPEGYKSYLGMYDTQKAISLLHRLFEDRLGALLNLYRVSAPLFVEENSTPQETPTPEVAPPVTPTPEVTNYPNPVKTPNINQESVSKPSKTKISSAKNKKSKKVVVKWKKINGAKSYQVQYALNKKFTKSNKTKFTTKETVTLTKLKKKKTYYIRVRAYTFDSKGNVIYGDWSKVKKLKIKK